MPFLKSDLTGKHYTWSGGVNTSNFTGAPGKRLFNRNDGNQILFMINFYGSLSGYVSLKHGRRMEEMLLKDLPADAKNESSVFNWLREAFATIQ